MTIRDHSSRKHVSRPMDDSVDTPRALNLGLIGLGYWGPNLLRVASELEDVEVTMMCDIDDARLKRHARRHRHIAVTGEIDDVLRDESIEAVLIATPICTHYDIARRSLQAGKHVLVEKPMAQTTEQCVDLIGYATERKLVLMPGHTFIYSPPVVAVKEMLDRQELGEIYFITATRVNLGIHKSDSSVIYDLAPHDFSILRYWLGQPMFVRAIGRDSVVAGVWDVAFIDLGYSTGTLVRVELSWLAPTKLRRTVVAGRTGMVVYDDTANEQLRVYDSGIDLVEPLNFGEHQLAYRTGDVVSPRLPSDEPLRLELEDFLAAIRLGHAPRSNMYVGLDVVRMVESAELSMRRMGAPVPINLNAGEKRRTVDRRQTQYGMPWFAGPTVRGDQVPDAGDDATVAPGRGLSHGAAERHSSGVVRRLKENHEMPAKGSSPSPTRGASPGSRPRRPRTG